MLVAFIVACTAAAKMGTNSGANAQVVSFAAVWTSLLLIVLSIAGTVIMRRVRIVVDCI